MPVQSSQPPEPYERSYSFTDFSQSNPTTPHQGQKIDQELNNVQSSLNETIFRLGEIQADDGKLRTTAMDLAVVAEVVEQLLTDAPVQAVNAAGAQQVAAVNDAGDAKVAELEAVLSSQNALDAIAAKDLAETAAVSANTSALSASGSAVTAQGYANTALQAKNSAIVHAQVAVDAAASIPLIVGPVGPAGPQGQQGIPGVAGQPGPAGQQGVQGIQGIQGIQGVPGVVSASSPLSYDAGTQNISINLGGYATESWVNGQGFASQSDWRLTAVASSSFVDLNNAATSGSYNFTYYDGYAGADVTTQFEIQSPIDGNNYNGYSVSFDDTQPNGYFNVIGTSVTIGINGYSDMQQAVSALNSGSSSGGWKLLGSGSPYAFASVLTGAGRTVYNVPITAQPGDSLVLRQGLFSNLTETIKGFNWNDYLIGTTSNGILTGYAKSGFLTAGDAAYFAIKSGTTFTGKVNFAPGSTISPINIGSGSSPSSSVAGDIWMGTNTISYKDGANLVRTITANGLTNTFSAPQIIDTTATTPALRVTQKGTGNVLLVEDAINPDTTALVVEQSGNVGIGVATGFAATAKLEVVGNTKSTTLSTGSGPTFSVNSTTTHTGGSDSLDLLVTINGVNYRIGLRPA